MTEKILEQLAKQNEVLSDIRVDMAKVVTELHYHIEGTHQNREAIRLFKDEFKHHRDSVEKRFDSVERHAAERAAILEGQARVFRWSSLLLGIVASIVGIVFTLSRTGAF